MAVNGQPHGTAVFTPEPTREERALASEWPRYTEFSYFVGSTIRDNGKVSLCLSTTP